MPSPLLSVETRRKLIGSFKMKVFEGVFQEAHKIRYKAAARSSGDYMIRDAGQSLWAIVQTSKLTAEMAAMGSTMGHPLLAPYMVPHLHRHWLGASLIRKIQLWTARSGSLRLKLKPPRMFWPRS
jgi:hypothetical protein